eukprot:TRINITY_DN13606_c0_g1_i1.p1 TRINITY_DN13606_c0_g1~~TRINITY_DN13606_c0_g1_i1.p1  ORF type:complete len:651 (+),score=275.06 TRINITY_DN13606_c0_g1_i1:40-1992(+)
MKLFALVISLAILSLVSLSTCAFVDTVYTITLTGEQVVPFQSGGVSGTKGTGFCILDRNSIIKTLECKLQHDTEEVVSVSINRGIRGFNGNIVYDFSHVVNHYVYETFSLFDQVGYTVDQQIEEFLNGRWYIQVITVDFPNGEIRGQLEHEDRVYSFLDTKNTIPRSSGTTSTGIALATYSFNSPLRDLAVDVVHNVPDPTGIDIHRGEIGEIGRIIYEFEEADNPIFDELTYTIGEETDLFEDLHYLNLRSRINPKGDIRGQMITIDYMENVAFTARLNSEQEIPDSLSNAVGCAIVTYDCDERIMEYFIVHDIENPTSAFLHAGPIGEIGSARFSLSRSESPIYGAIQLTLEEEFLLYSQQLYFNIYSGAFSSGEIRGQITIEYDFYAYISGTNVVPPVTTSSVGCATMDLIGDQSRIMDYQIIHHVSDPDSTAIRTAREGENGGITFRMQSTRSPIEGNDYILDDDELQDLKNENLYLSVASGDFPFGEIRGQIKRIKPCVVSRDDSLTLIPGIPSIGLPSSDVSNSLDLQSTIDRGTIFSERTSRTGSDFRATYSLDITPGNYQTGSITVPNASGSVIVGPDDDFDDGYDISTRPGFTLTFSDASRQSFNFRPPAPLIDESIASINIPTFFKYLTFCSFALVYFLF